MNTAPKEDTQQNVNAKEIEAMRGKQGKQGPRSLRLRLRPLPVAHPPIGKAPLPASARVRLGVGCRAPTQELTVHLAQWQARAKALIRASMHAQVPELVKTSACDGALTPIQVDVLELKREQKELDDSPWASAQEGGLNALPTAEVSGHTRGAQGRLEPHRGFRGSRPLEQAADGASRVASRSGPSFSSGGHRLVCTSALRGREARSGAKADSPKRCAPNSFVSFPLPGGGGSHEDRLQSYPGLLRRPVHVERGTPPLPGGGTQFGIIFPDRCRRRLASRESSMRTRTDAPPGERQEVTPRLTTPHTEEVKQKGILALKAYEQLDRGYSKDQLRTNYSRIGSPRAIISFMMVSGEICNAGGIGWVG